MTPKLEKILPERQRFSEYSRFFRVYLYTCFGYIRAQPFFFAQFCFVSREDFFSYMFSSSLVATFFIRLSFFKQVFFMLYRNYDILSVVVASFTDSWQPAPARATPAHARSAHPNPRIHMLGT